MTIHYINQQTKENVPQDHVKEIIDAIKADATYAVVDSGEKIVAVYKLSQILWID